MASDAWQQTKATASTAREKTEFLLRENPVPTVIGALAVGLVIGLAIRYSSESSEREREVKSAFGRHQSRRAFAAVPVAVLQVDATSLRRFRRCGEGRRRSFEKRGRGPLCEAAAEEVALLAELKRRRVFRGA